MAGMFYSLQEAASKLKKTEKDVKELVKMGRLREFRDGANLLFKVDEVEALLSDTSIMASKPASPEPEPELELTLEPDPSATPEAGAGEEEISLVSDVNEVGGGDGNIGDLDLETMMAGEGMDSLSGPEKTAVPTEDTVGTTGTTGPVDGEDESIEKIEEDVSLDSFGSGSGLLDLSLQADDTSLGNVLDDIYAGSPEDAKEATEAEAAAGVMAEADQMIPEMAAAAPAPMIVQTYAEPEPDAVSNAMGYMMFLPQLVVIFTAAVALLGARGIVPEAVTKVQSIIWYVLIGLAVAAMLIVAAAYFMSGQGVKTPKKGKEAAPAAGN